MILGSAVYLPNSVAVIVCQGPMQVRFVDGFKRLFVEAFGGFGAVGVTGGWIMQSDNDAQGLKAGDLAHEQNIKVEASFAAPATFEFWRKFYRLVHRMWVVMGQDAVSVYIDGSLCLFVDEDAFFKDLEKVFPA